MASAKTGAFKNVRWAAEGDEQRAYPGAGRRHNAARCDQERWRLLKPVWGERAGGGSLYQRATPARSTGRRRLLDTAAAIKNGGVAAAQAGVGFEQLNAAIQVLAEREIKGGEAGHRAA